MSRFLVLTAFTRKVAWQLCSDYTVDSILKPVVDLKISQPLSLAYICHCCVVYLLEKSFMTYSTVKSRLCFKRTPPKQSASPTILHCLLWVLSFNAQYNSTPWGFSALCLTCNQESSTWRALYVHMHYISINVLEEECSVKNSSIDKSDTDTYF